MSSDVIQMTPEVFNRIGSKVTLTPPFDPKSYSELHLPSDAPSMGFNT